MRYNNIYKYDIQKLALILTPIFWRTRSMYDLLTVYTEGIKLIYSNFRNFRYKSTYKVTHNGQVIVLEAVLNDYFDREDRLIFISDAPAFIQYYLYSKIEDKPKYLGVKYLYDKNALAQNNYEFIVNVPIALKPFSDFENQIKALVNYYKLASKRYKIEYF